MRAIYKKYAIRINYTLYGKTICAGSPSYEYISPFGSIEINTICQVKVRYYKTNYKNLSNSRTEVKHVTKIVVYK